MTRTILSVSGCCAVAVAGFLAAREAPFADVNRTSPTPAAQAETEIDFVALRAEADAAIHRLIQARAGNSSI